MPMLEFHCQEPLISFGARFNVRGKADRIQWVRPDVTEAVPDLSEFEITWLVVSNRSVFESYATAQANSGQPICSRIPNFADYWRDAKGMIRRYSPAAIEISLAVPPTSNLEAFMTGVFASRLSLQVITPRITFAENLTAPSPTVRAFLEDYEPAFFGNYSDSDSNYSVFTPARE